MCNECVCFEIAVSMFRTISISIRLGGAPDIVKFTGNRFSQGFTGNIIIVEGLDTNPVNVGANAVSGYNVTPYQELVLC